MDTAAPPPDPCPAPSIYDTNCDRNCPHLTASCPAALCGTQARSLIVTEQTVFPFIVRTPQAPGSDPNCATQCDAGGFSYGLGYTVYRPSGGPAFTARVGAPWVIVKSQVPFCTDSYSQVGNCESFPTSYGSYILVMTADPNAPARNVSFDTATAQPCP
jgi:hypothetical protein